MCINLDLTDPTLPTIRTVSSSAVSSPAVARSGTGRTILEDYYGKSSWLTAICFLIITLF